MFGVFFVSIAQHPFHNYLQTLVDHILHADKGQKGVYTLDYIGRIREQQPLIYNIMNEVATNFAANGLIAIGASPSMSNTPKEAEENAQAAEAVVLNLGTLTENRAEAMIKAGIAANEKGIPVVLDPIAVGATVFRTKVIKEIVAKVKLTAIRANAGEI